MSPTTIPAERRVTLDGVSWQFYQNMLDEVGESHVRLTFDRGRLEIMSPLPIHEQVKKVLARLIEAYADEMHLTIEGLGSTTFDREDLQKGLEPDECYYVANASAVIGKEEFDWTIDPPPDLAIEVDISRPDVARQPIYAALGVAEIWRYDGREVVSLHRVGGDRASGEARYVAGGKSLAFPELAMGELNRLLQVGLAEGQTAAVRGLREWCRAR
jgi:Uma2 family endonuclease